MTEFAAVTWTPATPAGVAVQKRVAAENLGTAPSEKDAVLVVIQPNGNETAWNRRGQSRPVPPRP